jgi:hypothetical protein
MPWVSTGGQESPEAAADRGQDDVVHGAAKLPLDRLELIELRPGPGVAPLLADVPAQRRPRDWPQRWGQLRDGPQRAGCLPDRTAGIGYSTAQRAGFPHREHDHVQRRLSGQLQRGRLGTHGPVIGYRRRRLSREVEDHAVQVGASDTVDHAVVHL